MNNKNFLVREYVVHNNKRYFYYTYDKNQKKNATRNNAAAIICYFIFIIKFVFLIYFERHSIYNINMGTYNVYFTLNPIYFYSI